MPIETIHVEYVNQPKPGKKMGSVKAADGRYFGVYPDKLDQYTAGQPITIEYTSNTVDGPQGARTFHNVKRIVTDGGTAAPGTAPQAPAPAARGGNNAEQMFVMGFCNRFFDGAFGNGVTIDQVSADELAVLIRKLRFAWHEGFKLEAVPDENKDAPESTKDELDDEIPF